MIGQPKYKIGDTVNFSIEMMDGTTPSFTGDIRQVDKYGCFDDVNDVCYDIIVCEERYITEINKKGECCYKHVSEGNITGLAKEK